MKALQDKGIAKERVITRLHKRIKNLTDGQEQYKGAFWTLNQEVKELRLEEEGCQKKKEQKAKEAMEKELTALLSQVEMAKADIVKEFKASQTFIDSCAEYYGVGFKDCLKKVKSIYPHLDLSKVSIDDPFLSTPAGDTVLEKSDDFSESEVDPKDDSVILAQPTVDQLVIPLNPSANPLNAEDPLTQDVQDPPSKGGEIPQHPPSSYT